MWYHSAFYIRQGWNTCTVCSSRENTLRVQQVQLNNTSVQVATHYDIMSILKMRLSLGGYFRRSPVSPGCQQHFHIQCLDEKASSNLRKRMASWSMSQARNPPPPPPPAIDSTAHFTFFGAYSTMNLDWRPIYRYFYFVVSAVGSRVDVLIYWAPIKVHNPEV